MTTLQRQNVEVWGWSQDEAAPAKLDVWLVHYSAAAAHAHQARYGAGVVVQPGSQAPLHAAGRFDDYAPYFGGDRIELPGGFSCTSGPKVFGNKSGTGYMLTAGHCAAKGAAVRTYSGRLMGHVTNRRLCNYCIDGETVSGSYAPSFWVGGTHSSSKVWEDYGRPPVKGHRLTTDGSYTGEVRKNLVTNANMTVRVCETSTNCWYERYAFQVKNTAGHRACQRGDSGSPIYTYEGSTNKVIVNGILTAVNTNNPAVCYGIRIDALENYFHVHIA